MFAGGWGGEYIQDILVGIKSADASIKADVFTFINFSTSSTNPQDNQADVNFFKMPPLTDFDGIILLANSFNCKDELEYLSSEIKRYRIPAISIEYELEGIPKIVTDNYSGMYEMAMHLFNEHHVKDIVYIGGPKSHPESQTRLRALQDAAYSSMVSIKNDSIIYGDWGKLEIPNLINGYLANHPLPDVFVCANDIMAIATCDHLRDLGFKVPSDVLVTGYDCIGQGQNYHPPITSVSHSWIEMGALAIDRICALVDGEKIARSTTLNTRLVVGGTCGCVHAQADNLIDEKPAAMSRPNFIMDPIQTDSHFRHFYSAVRKVSSKEDLHYNFSYLFQNSHEIEGNEFMLLLDPEFFNIVDNNTNLHINGHCDKYDCICELNDGKKVDLHTINYRDAIFGDANCHDNNCYYVFMPLHAENVTYGFARLNGELYASSDNQYYSWSGHMMQALEVARNSLTIHNLYNKVHLLSVTDPLTGVYNRAGCESISYPMLLEHTKSGGTSVVMLVDIDKMKQINDIHGHSQGDLAILLVTKALTRALTNNYNVTRFGGDEFFVCGTLDSPDKDIESVIDNINSKLKDCSQEANIEFNLLISIGYAKIKPNDISDIEKGIALADSNMYEIKKEHHK